MGEENDAQQMLGVSQWLLCCDNFLEIALLIERHHKGRIR